MLILQRKAGERIMIGKDTTVTVLSADRGRARIGIDAPKDVAVHREEIYEQTGPEAKNAPSALR